MSPVNIGTGGKALLPLYEKNPRGRPRAGGGVVAGWAMPGGSTFGYPVGARVRRRRLGLRRHDDEDDVSDDDK